MFSLGIRSRVLIAVSVIFSNGFIHRRREEIIVFQLDF